tara:strand:- start:240 stop:596 length:357 start_codon:yes stop_codon:yes gene_type:complete
MGLAKSLEKVAGTVITKFGGDVTVRYVTPGVYNTTSGTAAEATSDTEAKGVLSGISKGEVNGLIQSEDKRLTVAAVDLPSAPATKDRVVIDSLVYQIITVNTVEQEGVAITHELILRG